MCLGGWAMCLGGKGKAYQTAVASLRVGIWRVLLMPIDTCKTILQVDGKSGFRALLRKVRGGQFGVLFQGSLATAIAAIMSHYPWWLTYRLLSESTFFFRSIKSRVLKRALIGFCSSFVSDVVINSIKVIKTTKQSIGAKSAISYTAAIKMILSASGYVGLFTRGLPIRIITNGINSVIFVVCWNSIRDWFGRRRERREMKKLKNNR